MFPIKFFAKLARFLHSMKLTSQSSLIILVQLALYWCKNCFFKFFSFFSITFFHFFSIEYFYFFSCLHIYEQTFFIFFKIMIDKLNQWVIMKPNTNKRTTKMTILINDFIYLLRLIIQGAALFGVIYGLAFMLYALSQFNII